MPWSTIQSRYRRSRWWLLAFLLLIALITADQLGLLLVPRDADYSHYHNMLAPVSRVIDGDTIDIATPDTRSGKPFTRIRLWGIDCPEESHSEKPAEPYAHEATSFTAATVENKTVRLILEPHRLRDSFGRLLAHVETTDGSDLSALLLQNGLCTTDERWPHADLLRYSQIEREARRKKLNLWSDHPPPDISPPPTHSIDEEQD